MKKKPRIHYDKDSDVLWIALKEGAEDSFEEIAPGVNVEYDEKGKVIGFEVLNFSKQMNSSSLASLF